MSTSTYQRLEGDFPSDTDGLLLHTLTPGNGRRSGSPQPSMAESATGPSVHEEVTTESRSQDARQTALPVKFTGMPCYHFSR
jgi:hypothetical protein